MKKDVYEPARYAHTRLALTRHAVTRHAPTRAIISAVAAAAMLAAGLALTATPAVAAGAVPPVVLWGGTTTATSPAAGPSAPGGAWTQLSSGFGHTCGLAGGKAYCWGLNDQGQLGTGSTANSDAPVAVATETPSDGTDQPAIPPVSALSPGATLVQIAAGWKHTCALDNGGRAYCWGSNTHLQLGADTPSSSTLPVAVPEAQNSPPTTTVTWIAITAGGAHNCALDSAGAVWCWGDNSAGQLGAASPPTSSSTPVKATNVPKLLSIGAGEAHTCGRTGVGQVYCWGRNNSGQLGNNSTSSSAIPVPVSSGAIGTGKVVNLSVGGNHACALTTGSVAAVVCWGEGSAGQLGDGNTTDTSVPIAVVATAIPAGYATVSVSAGFQSSCAVDETGWVYCWGTLASTTSSTPTAIDRSGILAGLQATGVSAGPMSYGWTALVAGAPTAPTAPGAPPAPTLIRGNGELTIAWGAAAANRSRITVYTATLTPSGKSCSPGTELTCTITGLTNGTAYTATVRATNIVGTGPASPTATGTPATIPNAPTAVRATRGNAAVAVTWSAPGFHGGDKVTSYEVTSTPDSRTCTTTAPTGSTVPTCTLSGLTNGTSYTFTVTATNGIGPGPESVASAAVIPAAVPGTPTGATATRGNGELSVVWTAPASTGGSAITTYAATASPGGKTCTLKPAAATTNDGAALSCTIKGLANGTAYTVAVTATNIAGVGLASTPAAATTPATVPAPPSAITIKRGDGALVVNWTAPKDTGGSPLTGYTVTASPGGTTCSTTTAVTCTLEGLTNGTPYTISVSAVSAVGAGTASSTASAVTPATKPEAPENVAVLRGNGAVRVSWTAPTEDGGAKITSYTATAAPGNKACTSKKDLTCTITGLTNGTAITITVLATNAIGAGTPSDETAEVVPAAVPESPTAVLVIRGNGSAKVTWTVPVKDGGSPVTAYVATASPGGKTCRSADPQCWIAGLRNGTAYTVTVVAVNAAGAGLPSATSRRVLPGVAPSVVTKLRAKVPRAKLAVITWSAPARTGGLRTVYDYRVAVDRYGGTYTTWRSSSSSGSARWLAFGGWRKGSVYRIEVRARNGVGVSAISRVAVRMSR